MQQPGGMTLHQAPSIPFNEISLVIANSDSSNTAAARASARPLQKKAPPQPAPMRAERGPIGRSAGVLSQRVALD